MTPFRIIFRTLFIALWVTTWVAPNLSAALAAATVWEVRTTGSDTNGGGYVSGGTDWSQADAAQYSVTDGVTAGATTITSATAAFGTDVVGNIIYVQGGTGAVVAAWYQIISRTNATTIVVDRSTGLTAGTGVTLKIGGALASPGQAGALQVANNTIYVRGGSYTITSVSTNVAGGCVSVLAGTAPGITRWIGYTTTRTDNGRPILIADGVITTFTIFSITASASDLRNFEADGNARTSSRGFNASAATQITRNCIGRNFTNSAFVGGTAGNDFSECLATGCSTQPAFTGLKFTNCVAADNTVTGFLLSTTGAIAINCIAESNAEASSDGFQWVAGSRAINCTAYNNGRDGFRFVNSIQGTEARNCIAVANAGYGFNSATANGNQWLTNCAGYNNTSGNFSASIPAAKQVGSIALTGDPFVNAAGGNFALNDLGEAFGGTPGTDRRGKWLRGSGIPGVFPGGTTTGYLDIGAVQHQDAGGGVRGGPNMSGGTIRR